MSAPDTEFILACLQKRCVEISTKPDEKPCNGLVAFQDGLSFAADSIAKALPIFEAGELAIKARFKFARMNYESQNGPSDLFAEEYIAMAEIDPTTNKYTDRIEVRAQIVLKSLTAGASSIIDQLNGKG